jgi:hypothetical protein
MDSNELPLEPRHLGIPSGASKMIFQANGMFSANCAPILRHDLKYLHTERNELPLEARHLGVPSGASKAIYEPMVRLAQTVHLSCTDTNTVSKTD